MKSLNTLLWFFKIFKKMSKNQKSPSFQSLQVSILMQTEFKALIFLVTAASCIAGIFTGVS